MAPIRRNNIIADGGEPGTFTPAPRQTDERREAIEQASKRKSSKVNPELLRLKMETLDSSIGGINSALSAASAAIDNGDTQGAINILQKAESDAKIAANAVTSMPVNVQDVQAKIQEVNGVLQTLNAAISEAKAATSSGSVDTATDILKNATDEANKFVDKYPPNGPTNPIGLTSPVGPTGPTGPVDGPKDTQKVDEPKKVDDPSKQITDIFLTQADLDKALAKQASDMQKQFETMLKQQTDAAAKALEAQTQAQRQSAYEVMRSRFSQYGLQGLADEITNIFQGKGVTRKGAKIDVIPTTAEGFYLALVETQAYYDRFGIVNEQRIKEGFTALDEKTILGLEDQYQEVMKAYNAPPGFYDKPEDFRMFLRYNKSKAEVADTMQAFSDFVQSTDATARQQLKDYYGIDDAALTAYFADPEKGQPLLEAIAARNLNTAAALAGGLNARIANLAAGLGAAELTYAQQKQKYGVVARDIEFAQKAADIYGIDYTPEMAVAAEFGADQAALASQRRARRREVAEFQGQAGVGTTTLGTRTAGLI